MIPISPGVYSKINDFSEYVQGVPGTIAFIPFFADKGPDNEMNFISSKDYLIKYFGETPYKNFGTKYAMAHELAKNYLDVASSAYLMRVLPKDAKYANLVFDLTSSELDPEDQEGRLFKYRVQDDPRYASQFLSLDSFTGTNNPKVVNYTLYEKNGEEHTLLETFDVSFDPEATDYGESIFIVDIL